MIKSPRGDQSGKLSYPEVSVVIFLLSRFMMRRPSVPSGLNERYTNRLPSGEGDGNALLLGPGPVPGPGRPVMTERSPDGLNDGRIPVRVSSYAGLRLNVFFHVG